MLVVDENFTPNRRGAPAYTKSEKPTAAGRPPPATEGCSGCREQSKAVEEMEQLIARLDEFAAARSDLARLLFEAQHRAQEVEALQRSLSNAHMAVFDERQQMLRIKAENDLLRVQQVEDR